MLLLSSLNCLPGKPKSGMIIWRPYRSYSSGSNGNPSTAVLLEDDASWVNCMFGRDI